MTNFSIGRITPASVLAVAVAFGVTGAGGQAPVSVAFTGARVIDGTGRPPITNGVMVISNGTVEDVGAAATTPIPTGATRIDASGKTIIPGLINAHGHLSTGDEKLPMADQISTQIRLYAEYGITTLHSLGDDGVESVKVRDRQATGNLDRSRLYVSGPSLSQLLRGKSVQDARDLVDKHASMKVDIIKIHVDGLPTDPNKLKPDMYRAIIEQAHKHGLRVAAHVYYLDDAKGLLDAGVDVLAHSVRDQEVDAAFVSALKQRNVAYIPTLTRDLSVYVYETPPAMFKDPFFLSHVDAYRKQMDQLLDPELQARTRANADAQRMKEALRQGQRNLKKISDGGATVALGTDTGIQLGRWQGYFEHVELELMVEAGMSPMQTLVAATGGAARAMKLDRRLGTLEKGKAADLIVLGANPLDDIRNTRKIESIWIGGRRLVASGR